MKKKSKFLRTITGVVVNGKYWKSMPYSQAVKAAATLREKGNTVDLQL